MATLRQLTNYADFMHTRLAHIVLTWLAFMVIAVASGLLRETLLTPHLGEHAAHQLGTVVVCLLIAAVIVISLRRLRPTPAQALGVGIAWVVMTVIFEFGVFHFIIGHPMSVLLADYDLGAGRLWPLVLLTELLTPWLVAKTRIHRQAVLPIRPRQAAAALPAELRRAISREDLASLPIRRYEGDVCVVNTPAALTHAMIDIRQERVVGFDTETRPAFKKGESYLPCLVQVATARKVYLLQLEQLDCSAAVAEIMANPRIVKTGVALAGDVGQLKRLYPFEAASVVDLGHIAKRHGNTQTGLRNLAALFLGWRMAKGARTTNWSTPQLTEKQIDYAATDAWASRELYLCFETAGMLSQTGD